MDPVRASSPAASAQATSGGLTRGEVAYGLLLFATAAATLAWLVPDESVLGTNDRPVALFFLFFGLFTVSVGYSHPTAGSVSFDRIAQVSSVLVLGPDVATSCRAG